MSLIILVATIVVFIAWHAQDLSKPEEYNIMKFYHEYYLNNCTLDQVPELRAPLKLYLLCVSDTIFNNTRIIPFVFSIAMLPMTWLLALRITNSYRIAAISSMTLLASKIVGLLGTTGSFSSDWAFFFLASVYFMYRKPVLSGPFLMASLAAKGLPLLMLPVMIYWNFRDHTIQRRDKITNISSILIVTAIISYLWLSGNMQFLQPDGFEFDLNKFDPFSMYYVFRNDMLMFPIMAVSFTMLALNWRQRSSELVLVSGLWFYLLVVLLPVFTIYTMYDYRMIPLIIFSCIGFGMALDSQTLKDRILIYIIGKKKP